MKLHFLGANRQVTGSRYCLEAAGKRVLIDCGMFQERPYLERNWADCPLPASSIDCVLLTHAHIDHCGLLPKLVREGFVGPIHCTEPTEDLVEVMLRDAARIQMEDASYKKKRHKKEGRTARHEPTPLFTEADVESTLPMLRGVPYKKAIPLADNLAVMFHDAGHILGSAMLEIHARERGPGGPTTHLLFSGDIGQWNKPIIRDPSLFVGADHVVMESTYGDRLHQDGGDIETQLAAVVQRTVERGGKVLIPTFALERAQELLFHFSRLLRSGRVPKVDVYLDSPMAVEVTDIFRKHRDCFDEETWSMINAGESPLHFAGLRLTPGVRASQDINDVRGSCVIMATSGMCEAGRVKHHLRQLLGSPKNTVLFVGYQAAGTLGRQILEGAPFVRIHGKDWPCRAEVAQIYGFSGHADQRDLLRWIGHLKQPPKNVFLTHGEESAALKLRELIEARHGCAVTVPEYLQVVELT